MQINEIIHQGEARRLYPNEVVIGAPEILPYYYTQGATRSRTNPRTWFVRLAPRYFRRGRTLISY